MPVWSNEGDPPGPLNYVQIDDLIAFIRAPNDQTYTVRDPALNEPKIDPVTGKVETFKGWVDPNYKPAPGATPFPACWTDECLRSARRRARPAPSPAALRPTPARRTSKVIAQGIAFTTPDVDAPAGHGVRDRVRQPGRGRPRTTSRSRTRPVRSSSPVRPSPASRRRPTTCRRSPPGRIRSSAPCTRP